MTRQLVNLTIEIADLLLDGLARIKQRSDRSDQFGTILDQLLGPRGVVSWSNSITGEPTASVSYEADMTSPDGSWLRLRFSTPNPRDGQPRQVDQRVAQTKTRWRCGRQSAGLVGEMVIVVPGSFTAADSTRRDRA